LDEAREEARRLVAEGAGAAAAGAAGEDVR